MSKIPPALPGGLVPLDPIFAGLLDSMPSLIEPGETPQQMRQRFAELAANPTLAGLAPEVGEVADTEVSGADGPVPARIYRPATEATGPTVAFFHGGGYVIGGLDTHDGFCRELCTQLDAVVVSVDYRLAPEHPFPAGVEDCVEATRWVIDNVDELGGDRQRIAVAGDSAGGNFAAVVSGALAAEGSKDIAAQLLVYPATDVSRDYPSRERFGQGYFLDQQALEVFAKSYVTDLEQLTDPRMSPMLFDKPGLLPPTAVVTAEFDPLTDQGDAYAEVLTEAGVVVRKRRFDGLIHGFIHFGPFVPAAKAAVDETCGLLRGLLA